MTIIAYRVHVVSYDDVEIGQRDVAEGEFVDRSFRFRLGNYFQLESIFVVFFMQDAIMQFEQIFKLNLT